MTWLWCLLCARVAWGFNVDTSVNTRVEHTRTPGTMFGFSVQAHEDNNMKLVLVGAPMANRQAEPALERPGVVYWCKALESGCNEMGVPKIDAKNNTLDEVSNQWLGATVSSNGAGLIIACAPRYFREQTLKRVTMYDPIGYCYVTTSVNSTNSKLYRPCRQSPKLRSCQAGFSAAVLKDSDTVLMGAPGSVYQQGEMFHQKYRGPLAEAFVKRESEAAYMGYSVTALRLGVDPAAAAGVPRANNTSGMVTVYSNKEMFKQKYIYGDQMGAYFGYSLASSDVDGDGLDDVIVGAPMFTRNDIDGFEHGRVYVFYQGKNQNFDKNHTCTGEVSRGRFGLSVASLGDINLDGYGDFAVGAPYGGANGRGVVYIYHGSALGLREMYSQSITAEEASSPPYISTFGFSLSGGVDLDNNNYPDLVVGAYKSDRVFVFRSKPLLHVTGEVKFKKNIISLENPTCKVEGINVSCVILNYCLAYQSNNTMFMDFVVNLDLDSKKDKDNKRLFEKMNHLSFYSKKLRLKNGKQACMEIEVYLDKEIQDKLNPIKVLMTFEMRSKDKEGRLSPVLDEAGKAVFTDTLYIQKNCGSDNVCVPDLKLSLTRSIPKFSIGSEENLEIEIKVENAGDDAFNAAYYFQIPNRVNYVKVQNSSRTDEFKIICSISRDFYGNSTLKCDLGNPLGKGKTLNFVVHLQVQEDAPRLPTFLMEVNSTNPEPATSGDNILRLDIGTTFEAKLDIIGIASQPSLQYNASVYGAGRAGPALVHQYHLKNEGPAPVEQAELVMVWPEKTNSGLDLIQEAHVKSCEAAAESMRCAPLALPDTLAVADPDLEKLLQRCQHQGQFRCSALKCSTGPLKKRQEICFALTSIVNVSTLNEVYKDKGVNISTLAAGRVTQFYEDEAPLALPWTVAEARTSVLPRLKVNSAPIPLWIIVLAVFFGILILCLQIYLFYKWGFFKRKTFPTEELEEEETEDPGMSCSTDHLDSH